MFKFDIKDLNLYYGDFHALHGINMQVKPNEITAFIGPSGCGKSTLLKTLNRMNDLVEGCRIEGDVLLDGEDIYGTIFSASSVVRSTTGSTMMASVSAPERTDSPMWQNLTKKMEPKRP